MATKTKPAGRDVFVPIDGFVADIDGSPVNFHRNIRVSEAWLREHEAWRHLFTPIKVHYDVEEATARPGEPR